MSSKRIDNNSKFHDDPKMSQAVPLTQRYHIFHLFWTQGQPTHVRVAFRDFLLRKWFCEVASVMFVDSFLFFEWDDRIEHSRVLWMAGRRKNW